MGTGWEERAVHLHKLQRSREGDDRRWEECDVCVEINNLELIHSLSIEEGTPFDTPVRVPWIHGS